MQTDLFGNIIDPIIYPKGKAKGHMKIITVNDEWSTPRVLLLMKCLHFLFNPVFDYASSHINHKYSKYYTISDNALNKKWLYDGFLNPPYSLAEEFIVKAIKEWKANGIGQAVVHIHQT